MARWLSILLLGVSAVASAAEPAWRYEVAVGPGGRVLAVEAAIAPGASDELMIAPGADAFVRGLEISDGDRWRPLHSNGEDRWLAPRCSELGCRIRYHFLLGDAATLLGAPEAERVGGALVAPPSTWLVRPLHPGAAQKARFHFDPPAGTVAVAGADEAPGLDGVYQEPIAQLGAPMPAAFGPLAFTRVDVLGRTLDLAIAPGARAIPNAALLAALRRASAAVAGVFGRLPVERALVLALPADGAKVTAVARTSGGAAIVLRIGDQAPIAELARGGALARALLRFAAPALGSEGAWLADGLAAYYAPLARARAGLISPAAAWAELARALDTRGVRFCLLSDLRIREKSAGLHSLDDAMRALLGEGANTDPGWDLARTLSTADAAVGAPVIETVFGELDESPADASPPALLARLGVRVSGEVVTFDDAAPLAGVRRRLTTP